MSFQMPELIVESVIRDGVANISNNLDVIDNIFHNLTLPYLAKYGQREINKIKELFSKKQINIVHNLHDVGASTPCFSIQLGSDGEDRAHAVLEDHAGIIGEDRADADRLIVGSIIVTAYDELSGKVTVHASTDLSSVKKGNLFVDINEEEFSILSVQTDDKTFFLAKASDFDASGEVLIRSSISTDNFEEKMVSSDEQIIIGVHSKNALTTKYLYLILKYILVSRKTSLINRCFIVSSFHGSDFTRNMQYQADHVYNRFFTVTGKIEDSWKASEADQIENIEVQVLVERDEATAEDLDKETHTVKPT